MRIGPWKLSVRRVAGPPPIYFADWPADEAELIGETIELDELSPGLGRELTRVTEQGEGFSEKALETEAAAFEARRRRDRHQEDLNDRRQLRNQRDEFGRKMTRLLVLWLAAVMALLWAVGLGWLDLSPRVLVWLLGTTTADVIGLMVIILHFVFRDHSVQE